VKLTLSKFDRGAVSSIRAKTLAFATLCTLPTSILLASTLLASTLLTSCTTSQIQNSDRGPSSVANEFCPEENTVYGYTTCEKMYPVRPYIHVPGTHPTIDDAAEVYGELVKESLPRVALVDNAGTIFRLYDSSEKPFDVARVIGRQALRTNYTVYKVQGVYKDIAGENPDGSTSIQKSIIVSSIRPAVVIKGCAIDSGLAGVWTGKVTRRVGEKSFDRFRPTIPIHISIHSLAHGKPFEDLTKEQTREAPIALKNGEIFQMIGEIDNFDKDVHDQYGDFQNLAALGEANPFLGATDGKIKIYRMSSMHALGDKEFVIEFPADTTALSAMGMADLTFTPSDFIAIHSSPKTRAQLTGHETPNGFEMTLNPSPELSYEIPCH
jgi:hypothetical protein